LEDLGNSIKSLRTDVDSWAGLASEVQSIVPDIKDLRLKANEAIASQLLVDRLNALGVLTPLRIGLTPYLHGDQLNTSARALMDELKIDCKNCKYSFLWRRTGLTLFQLKK
jgi:hypothetical protein